MLNRSLLAMVKQMLTWMNSYVILPISLEERPVAMAVLVGLEDSMDSVVIQVK